MSIFKSKLKRRLLAFVFANAGSEFYVRELARNTGEDPGNVSRILRNLEEEGFFTSKSRGNLKFYLLNKSNPILQDVKNIISKTEGLESMLKNILLKCYAIEKAFIHGSYVKGGEHSFSDIDLVLVGDGPGKNFDADLNKIESLIGREINYSYFKPEEYEREKNKKGSFLNIVAKGKKIILKGGF